MKQFWKLDAFAAKQDHAVAKLVLSAAPKNPRTEAETHALAEAVRSFRGSAEKAKVAGKLAASRERAYS